MSHQPFLQSSPKTNQGPEARSHSLANKAHLLFGAPSKAPVASLAMCSYDRVLTFSQFTEDVFLFFVLKRALPNGLNCRSIEFASARHPHRAAKPEPQSVNISFPSISLPLQMSHCSFLSIRCPFGWEIDTHQVIFIS